MSQRREEKFFERQKIEVSKKRSLKILGMCRQKMAALAMRWGGKSKMILGGGHSSYAIALIANIYAVLI